MRLHKNPALMESLKPFRPRQRPHSPAVMRLALAPRRGLSRIGSSFRWRSKFMIGDNDDNHAIPSLIDTTSRSSSDKDDDEETFLRKDHSESRDSAPPATLSLIDECSEDLEDETPNSFISLQPPAFDDCDSHTEETDDETPEPSEDGKGSADSSASLVMQEPPDSEAPLRRVTFARTYQEIRFRKHENPRAVWYSRDDRKKVIDQCAKEIADCIRSDPVVFRSLIDQCKEKGCTKLCAEFGQVMHVRGLLRPCLTRFGHQDKSIRDWVQTPKRSVAAVLRVQQQGGTDLASIYRTFTQSSTRWAHYLAIADATELERASPYEKVHV